MKGKDLNTFCLMLIGICLFWMAIVMSINVKSDKITELQEKINSLNEELVYTKSLLVEEKNHSNRAAWIIRNLQVELLERENKWENYIFNYAISFNWMWKATFFTKSYINIQRSYLGCYSA